MAKHYLTLISFFFLSLAVQSQESSRLKFQASAGIALFTPLGALNTGLPISVGGRLSVLHQLPILQGRLFTGFAYTGSVYGTVSKEVNFVNADGERNATHLSVHNEINHFHWQTRYYTGKFNKVNAFAGVALGSTVFATHMNATREQEYHCPPADTDGALLFRNRSFTYAFETGILLPLSENGRSFIECQAQYHMGSPVKYLNTEGEMIRPGQATGDPNSSKEVRMRFLDLQTNDIHEHVIAREYQSAYRQLSFSLSWKYVLNGIGHR
jgi:hypothetical protein